MAQRNTKVKVKYYQRYIVGAPKMFIDKMNKNKAGENMGPVNTASFLTLC